MNFEKEIERLEIKKASLRDKIVKVDAVKEFAKYLIDKADPNKVIHISDLPDLVIEFNRSYLK